MNVYEFIQQNDQWIKSHLREFYESVYGDVSTIIPVSDGFRLNPCPVCGHNDCCTVSENGLKCFSGECSWKGNHVRAYYTYAAEKLNQKEYQAQERLHQITHIALPNMNPQEQERYRRMRRQQEILVIAEDFYHRQLMTCKAAYTWPADERSYTPIEYMLRVRRRSKKTLEDFSVGFVRDYSALEKQLLRQGFTKDEIKDSKCWCPEGLFVFFYHNPETNNIDRINTKNPFEILERKRNADGTYELGNPIKGFSRFAKAFYYTPGFSFHKPFIIVEGEHDLYALYEQGYTNVCASGGNLKSDDVNRSQKQVLEQAEDIVYTMFDNDEAGVNYTNYINDFLCDKDVRRISYDINYKDPDAYYRDCLKYVSLQELISKAEPLTTEKSKVKTVDGIRWSIANRKLSVDFHIKKRTDASGIIGDTLCHEGKTTVETYQNKPLTKVVKKFKALGIELQQAIEEYYNRKPVELSFEELVRMHKFSSKQSEIERRLAELMGKDAELSKNVERITSILGPSSATKDFVDQIMKVRGMIQAQANGISASSISKIKLAQTFDLSSGMGYIYFNYHKMDTDGDMKRLPYLLRSDGELIRLDLFKKVDINSVLILDGKFELPMEVPCAITADNDSVSLKDYWVERYCNNEIPEEELEPGYLLGRLEKYVERFYYFTDNRYYRVIALYIFMTYFYDVFSSIPYLYLNGEKGSGKTTLAGIVSTFAFNSKFSVSISGPALYRTLTVEGGTFVIDEMESLTSRAKSQENDFAAILKAGYYKQGQVYRSNPDMGNRVEAFSVYSPKVFCNIFGLDDVIEDRCITIKVPKINLRADMKKEDLEGWKMKNQAEREEMTSKLALCALRNFKRVAELMGQVFLKTESSRLTQILRPVIAIARMCDQKEIEQQLIARPDLTEADVSGTYENTFVDFCDDILSFFKESTDMNTPEGIIKDVVRSIAKEFLDLVPEEEKEYTRTDQHKYTAPIDYYPEEYKFVLNALHIKTFVEEATPENKSYTIKNNKTVMNVFNLGKEDMRRQYITVSDQQMIDDMNAIQRPRMWQYTIHIADIFPELIAEKQKKDSAAKDALEKVEEDLETSAEEGAF